MKSVVFTFTTHNHQPTGNFDNIIEEAYQHSYKPFFEMLARYPDVRIGTHFTGILLEWLLAKHPEYIALLKQLVARKQLEIVSGGFYEPILSVIPRRAQDAQIQKLSNWIRDKFDYEPRGMWLAERVWEQGLSQVLAENGIRYVFLDDTHFVAAGLEEKDLTGYYLTEDAGKTLAVFPISRPLRYTIPFSSVDETIQVLRDAASDSGDAVVCFADDGEKFGVWPDTLKHVYEDGWLEELLRKLSENKNWIHMRHASEIVGNIHPAGRIYLPNASYAEMMQWALPGADANALYDDLIHEIDDNEETLGRFKRFMRGGFWRNFFVKYPEANQLHKHMLRSWERLETLVEEDEPGALDDACDALLASQCNDAYWHGVFGGIYLPNLRHASYTKLIEADALLDKAEGGYDVLIGEEDYDCDGENELVIETEALTIFLHPYAGGAIREIDFKARHFNATNIIGRQREAYHAKLTKVETPDETKKTKSIHDLVQTKEPGLEKHLVYDWYRRGSLIEHFLGAETTLAEFKAMQFEEQGDFLRAPFEFLADEENGSVTLSRSGSVWQNGVERRVRVEKRILLTPGATSGALRIDYSISNESPDELLLRFASEWAFNFLAGNAHDRYFTADGQKTAEPQLASEAVHPGIGELRIVDEWLALSASVKAEGAEAFWRLPIETVSLSEAGFERVYQGSVILPSWRIQLSPRATWNTTVHVTFEPLKS